MIINPGVDNLKNSNSILFEVMLENEHNGMGSWPN